MQLTEVLHKVKRNPIPQECSMYLKESQGLPLLKNFPSHYKDFHKVKMRQRKKNDEFYKTFNEAFNNPNLRQRSITVNGESSFISENNVMEPFYVFPINGYKYLYSLEVTNSKQDYRDAFELIVEIFHDKEIVEDLLKYSYISKNLKEGIEHGSEIIIYNIPYCYAVRASNNYQEILNKLQIKEKEQQL